MLTVRGLRKTFVSARRGAAAAPALEGVDLDVADGSFATVLGPSGSGKTTLLRCLAGFETPDDGVITLGGRTLFAPATRAVAPAARGIGVVPQEGALFPHLTTAQNVGFGLRGRSRAQRRARVASLLRLVGLDGLDERRPHELSGGQQQRVALARALAPEPELILLDEPFSALDAQLRTALREEIRDLLHGLGTTAVLVTHDQAEALALADHLIAVRAGRVVSAGSPHDVYDQPADLELGRFLGDALVLPGHIARDGDRVRVACALGRLEVGAWHGADGACAVLIRPEQLALGRREQADDGASVGVVTSQSFFGHDSLVRVRLAEAQETVVVRVAGHRRYASGDPVGVAVVRAVSTYPAGRQAPHTPS